jgi:hypothetical protein
LVYLTARSRADLDFSEKMPIFAGDFVVRTGLNRIFE